MFFRFLVAGCLIALGGCHLQADAPADAPAGLTATPGDGLVVISFIQQPDLTYWIFYQAGNSVFPDTTGASILRDATAPQVVSRLVTGPLLNGTQYAFNMNATNKDSRAGPSSGVVVATPALAGVNWDAGAALSTQNLNGLAFSGSRLVAVGDSGTVLAGDFKYTSTLPPGVSGWATPTTFPSGFISRLVAVNYSGQFVALGDDGSILTSPDGLNWTLSTSAVPPAAGINDLAAGVGLTIVVGNSGAIFTSPDLSNWTQQGVGKTTSDLLRVSFLNGLFLATGANGALLTSPDGVNWILQNSGTANTLRGAAFASLSSGPLYVVVGDAGAVVTSRDAVSWTPMTIPVGVNLTGAVFGSRFVAVAQGGTAVYSDDGLNWTQTTASINDLSRVLFVPGMYMAVGAAGANVVSK
jgi:hypothetical protein